MEAGKIVEQKSIKSMNTILKMVYIVFMPVYSFSFLFLLRISYFYFNYAY